MTKRFALVPTLTCLMAISFPALAGNAPRGVVELFTSQGCSSCPPADALLRELAKDTSIVAISLPVTYWDYLGWKDTLAEKAFSKRQRAYAETRGDGQIYTPQAVINGSRHALGSDRKSIEAAIANKGEGEKGNIDKSLAKTALTIPLDVSDNAGTLKIAVPQGQPGQTAALWILAVSRSHNVAIGRGENTGRTVVYTNVVRRITKLGDWSGQAMTIDVSPEAAKPPGTDGYVVLLQAVDNGRPSVILGAAKSDGL
ncbi:MULTISPECIES: DUF1223 domain-containing protein [unclassified Chelatococcus]|uniref:DUF1223 domain-containing protein n=1 Tax=unclassified Chelatococcus TaxID=2638111 RepID=UPI001BCBC9C6|nr:MULTISPECIES: DUF1223 domain-containing protein [unclassified Chelatococcus]CAH1657818.1 conserved exported hypothetical protein [Hyphomicrobiales bacterium]MBS7740725.1 DUF1223 domain-containing protein [Chelatococcus sp. HY11]MBX3546041.1 DUF1223 domain-containing protein [Chelatococcus sp.]MCO5079668.1 DUF1223 domain-containing protein [Chelatococcus sp.]CAH1684320.1 conserved exported hypothetical protein [Hyphomicrobiales bacterium]